MADTSPKERETQDQTPSGRPRGITIRRLGKKEATSPGIVSGAQGN